jgi:NAD(P)H-hydrate repair Nnr-like enzyme with NAD(P)H-hydrate epimerase domain
MADENTSRAIFRTDTGAAFGGASAGEYAELYASLTGEYGISTLQICEAASFSMAMVIRVALGLSANEARVCALAADNLCGWCALATMRHLRNAGSECFIITDREVGAGSVEWSRQWQPLQKMGINAEFWPEFRPPDYFTDLMQSCHNIIFGLFNLARPPAVEDLVGQLNEIQTPIHCIQAPLGIDIETGERGKHPLFAASTLSLGLPLSGLHAGRDYAGRHYLCDIALTREHYEKFGATAPIFTEQPVIRILPVDPEQ